ncbi:MAG: hypothetical protein ACTHMS_24050 [Jatrophihabitans sp.]|uniref:hypothetical protein n=1 Tax=Jatrophihabitans sp. TaxID=1932789 RepID=UPI003F811A5E
MGAFAGGGTGVEPLVGEIRGLRTFRVDEAGLLLPLYSECAWDDGDNIATCAPPTGDHPRREHVVPSDDCECGYYAYGTLEAARRQRQARFVLAIVACWGNVVAGTQGVRAEHARVEAIWVAPTAPAFVRRRLGVRYPSARLYDDVDVMLAEFPLTALPCYEPPRRRGALRRAGVGALLALLLTLGVLPLEVLRGTGLLWDLWLAATTAALAATAWLAAGARWAGHVAAALVMTGFVAWLVAPWLGLSGWLLRAPLLRGAAVAGWGFVMSLRPGWFPVVPSARERTFCGVRASG